jgi:peptide/nickel transport system substrate-binding protein
LQAPLRTRYVPVTSSTDAGGRQLFRRSPASEEGTIMDDNALRELIREVKAGRLSRRDFVRTVVGVGLTGPISAQMLASAGVARAQSPPSAVAPTRRGGGGPLRRLMVAAPTLLNPRLAVALKDWEASRIFNEPLSACVRPGDPY